MEGITIFNFFDGDNVEGHLVCDKERVHLKVLKRDKYVFESTLMINHGGDWGITNLLHYFGKKAENYARLGTCIIHQGS